MSAMDFTRCKLGGEGRKLLAGCPGFYMRVDDDLRKCVVFLGLPDDPGENGGIRCGGTGFLLQYETFGYLITARHVAEELGSDPFVVRINMKNGPAKNIDADQIIWHFHPDPDVDIALAKFLGCSARRYCRRHDGPWRQSSVRYGRSGARL